MVQIFQIQPSPLLLNDIQKILISNQFCISKMEIIKLLLNVDNN